MVGDVCVACCLLVAACGWLLGVSCVLYVVLFADCCLLVMFVAFCAMCVVRCVMCVVCMLVVRCLLFGVCGLCFLCCLHDWSVLNDMCSLLVC